MASELLASVIGSGGGFTTKFSSGGIEITTSATGTLFTLTPPAGQKVRLSQVTAAAVTTNLITITVGGDAVLTSKVVSAQGGDSIFDGGFAIGGNPNGQPIIGEINEVVVMTTNIATTSAIYYSYEFGA